MASRYRLTIEADTLAELAAATDEAATALLQSTGAAAQYAELAPLAVTAPPVGEPPPFYEIPPAPDYAGAGLTYSQAAEARQVAAVYAPPPAAPNGRAPTPPYQPAPAYQPTPACPVHIREMVWKGGGQSRSGKGLPLWSCPVSNCREAVWPPRQ